MSNTIQLNIQTLTPLHIGSGRELGHNFDYLRFGNEIAVTDSKKILQILGEDEQTINAWVNAINHSEDIVSFIKRRKNDLTATDVAQRILQIKDRVPDKSTIKEQLHLGSPLRPILPGSSIKGSIRTALLTKLIYENPNFVQTPANLGRQHGDRFKYKDALIMAEYVAPNPNERNKFQPEPRTDLFRLLRIGDAYFDAQTCVVQNNIINQLGKSWGVKDRETSYWECIPKAATSQFSLQIPADLIQQMRKERKLHAKSDYLTPANLMATINQHTLELINTEIQFWEAEGEPLAIGSYLDLIDEVYKIGEKCDIQRECILRVGAANGWDFMTGAWAKADNTLSNNDWTNLKRSLRRKPYPDNMPFPKTRKLLNDGMPLGFVKVSIV
jgi:CRISPR-associated protein Csm5